MIVKGFIGASGTGKSQRASWVAREEGLDCIIDDGLLIIGNKVIAGQSAKKESSKIASIRRALFMDVNHAREVSLSILKLSPKGIFVLGTSDKMINAITEKLNIPKAQKRIYIEDVASEYEIEQALNIRKGEGKHVIPVPTFEIKKDFSGFLLDPLNILRRKGKGHFSPEGEKSVVRPTFSYLGNYSISDHAIYQLVEHETSKIKGIRKISRYRVEQSDTGVLIDMDVMVEFGFNISKALINAQVLIRKNVEKITTLNIDSINITAKSLFIKENA